MAVKLSGSIAVAVSAARARMELAANATSASITSKRVWNFIGSRLGPGSGRV